MITEDKIKKFLDSAATAEEAEDVYTYFRDNPDVLNKYVNQEEWNNIVAKQLPTKIEADIDKVVLSKTASIKISKGFKYLAAASLIGIISLTVYLFSPFSKNHSDTLYAVAKEDSLANFSQAIKIVKLIDGSTISLYPETVLYYPSAFEADNRTVRLKGKAKFDVAKDKKRPFTVISADITTTALGTVFIVDDTDKENIAVSLLEGKVVLRPVGEAAFNEVYLSSNEKCIINKKDYRVSLQSIDVPALQNNMAVKKPTKNIETKKENKTVFVDAIPVQDALDFNQTPLYHVFNVLAGNYVAKISYNQKDVEGLFFTGKFNKEAQLESILKIVCEMNDLKTVETKGKIQISKR